jgi:hypothetical protein
MGALYMGLSGLFTSILQVLSLAELGIGEAMIFSMYEPIAQEDTDKICALLNLYKKIYRIIGIGVLIVGLCLVPFLGHLIKGTIPKDVNIYWLYVIYLLNTVISYLFYGYRTSIFIANQRYDIKNKISIITSGLLYVLQIIVIITTKNYNLYCILIPIITVIDNVIVNAFSSVSNASEQFGLSETSIYKYISDKKEHGGYIFKEIGYDLFLKTPYDKQHINKCKEEIIRNNKKHLICENVLKKKKIKQYSLKGKFIKVFDSINQAMRETGCANISKALKKESHKDGDYMWFYDDGIYSEINPYKYIHNTQKRVLQINPNTQIVVGEFESITCASIISGISIQNISKVLRGTNKTAGGYIWEYVK